jgi:TIR domain
MSLIFNTFQAFIGTLTGGVLNDIHGASNVKRGSSLTARCRLAVPEKGFSRGAGREPGVPRSMDRSFPTPSSPWLPTPEASATMPPKRRGHRKWLRAVATRRRAPARRPVFVSYASHDTAFANAIVEALERNGVRCWIAPRDVNAGRTLYWRDHSRDRCREGQRADIVEQCDVLAACSERSGALCFQATSDRRCE